MLVPGFWARLGAGERRQNDSFNSILFTGTAGDIKFWGNRYRFQRAGKRQDDPCNKKKYLEGHQVTGVSGDDSRCQAGEWAVQRCSAT